MLFILSPVAGLLVIVTASGPLGIAVGIGATYLVGIPHYLSSFSFYLGDDNLRYYWQRRMAFFVGPLILIALYGVVFKIDGRIIQSTMFVWNVYHVSRQSVGILSIYRRLNRGPDTERNLAQVAIIAANATMAFWFIDRFAPLHELLSLAHPAVPVLIPLLLLPIAATSVGLWLYRIGSRTRSIAFPEAAFAGTSLLLFHPYLWVEDSGVATMAMLMGHFIQYLAIVWLLNHRKYATSQGSWHEQLLAKISAKPQSVLGAIGVAGLVFYAFNEVTALVGAPTIYLIAWNLLTLLHFYADGLVWAFKRPQVRESIGPYVAMDSHCRPD